MRAGGTLLVLLVFTLLFTVPDAGASAFNINMGGVVIAKEIKSIREQKYIGCGHTEIRLQLWLRSYGDPAQLF